jgi:hypothetical protein
MDTFAAWFVVTGDATPDGMRVVRSVLGAISSLAPNTLHSMRPKLVWQHHPDICDPLVHLLALLDSIVIVHVLPGRANMAHVSQPGPDSGHGFQVKVLTSF